MKMTIGAAIRTVRNLRNLTTYQIAERSELSRGYITQVENDERIPTWTSLGRIAEGLGVPVSYLTMMVEADHPVLAPLTAIIYTQMFEGVQ